MSDSNDASENSIQFVEFINLPFLNITGENGQIVNNSGEHIIIEETGDNDQESKSQEIQYLLDTNQENSVLNKHMIVVHEGKQFIFSNDQINEKGEIILNSENCLDNYILSENPNEETFVMQEESYAEDESIENNEVNVTQSYQVVVDKPELEERDTKDFPLVLQEFDENESGIKDPLKIKQYAILRDGQLFIQEGELQEDDLFNCTEEDSDYNVTNLNNEINNGESTSLDDEDPLSNFGVAGKNLITGQTISLDGFITKFSSKKYKPTVKNVELKSNLNFSGVFGKSGNKKPKKLSCKILAIKRPGESMNTISKQIENDLNSSATPSTSFSSTSSSKEMKTQTIHAIIQPSGEIETDNDSNFHMDSSHMIPFENKYSEYTYSQEPMDALVVKTLCGLMDMESFSKHLIKKNLIIKNTYKRVNSATDQCIYKNITYFKGTMRKTHSLHDFNGVYEHWTFDQNIMLDKSAGDQYSDDEQSNDNSNIDLNISEVDTQQIDLNKDTVTAVSETSDNGDGNVLINKFMVKREPTNVPPETVGVHVIIIEDEHGKKKTKVVIPKLYNITRFCSICNKLYRNPQLYKRHMRTAHASNEDKTNTCDLCNKKFKDPFTLTRHRRIHNGDKNYQCNICCKAFNTSESLKRHITIHIPSLRPLQCLKCMQRFTDQSSLKKHMLLHTGLKPYQCDVCFKRFAQCGDLNFHRKIHDPSKQFTCETCGKEFNRHSNLLRHLDIHKDNGTIFKCEICGCSYNFMSSLTRHIVNHHMKEHVS